MTGLGAIGRRMLGSVRVRVAIVAGLTFAVALTAGSVLLLHTLETRLIDGIRDADESVLQAQAIDILSTGLPEPSQEAQSISIGGQAVAFPIAGEPGQTIVASASGRIVGPPVSGSIEAVPSAFKEFIINHEDAPGSGRSAIVIVDDQSAGLLGVTPGQGQVLISTRQVFPGLSLTTASSLAEVDRTLTTTRTILWYVVPLLVLLVAGLAWLLVGRALRPVHALTSRASTISATSLHERVPVPPVDDEVSELATTINSMLDRLEASDVASRRLVSDASHELRTPIAVMRTEIEVARRNPDTEWSDVSANVLIEVERLQCLVDDLLLLARINEGGARADTFSLLDTVRDVAGRRRRLDVDIVATLDSGDDIAMVGDGAAIQRALDHVVANAARHASSRVEVSIDGTSDSNVAIHIDDDGPGIPFDDRERVLQRFERLDEARSRDAGGSGLGLAVAVDVMAAHAGSVSIDDSPLGGARITLLMPSGSPSP